MPHPAPAIAACTPLPAVSWLSDPIAARILADLAKNPPEREIRRAHYARTTDEWQVYVGHKVDMLRAVEKRWALDAVRAADAGVMSEMDALREADPLHRDFASVPAFLRMSSAVDRVIYERVAS